jgi:hypothetical protein
MADVKMNITIQVTVDPDKWADEYGDVIGDRRAYKGEIRESLTDFAIEATRTATRHLPVTVEAVR